MVKAHLFRVKHKLERRRLAAKVVDYVKDDEALDATVWEWLKLVTCLDQVEDYTLPNSSMSEEEIWMCYEAYLELPDKVIDECEKAIKDAQIQSTPTVAPPQSLTPEQASDPN